MKLVYVYTLPSSDYSYVSICLNYSYSHASTQMSSVMSCRLGIPLMSQSQYLHTHHVITIPVIDLSIKMSYYSLCCPLSSSPTLLEMSDLHTIIGLYLCIPIFITIRVLFLSYLKPDSPLSHCHQWAAFNVSMTVLLLWLL